MMQKGVTQEHGMGCAVACTAYILGCLYPEALWLYENPHHAWERGFYCKEIVNAFLKAGKLYAYKRIKALEDELLDAPGTIVFIEKSPQYPAGHFLARTHDGLWMDPWINFPLIAPAESGFRKELPGHPLYAVYLKG